jgi:hypothetical protein
MSPFQKPTPFTFANSILTTGQRDRVEISTKKISMPNISHGLVAMFWLLPCLCALMTFGAKSVGADNSWNERHETFVRALQSSSANVKPIARCRGNCKSNSDVRPTHLCDAAMNMRTTPHSTFHIPPSKILLCCCVCSV